jgi:hypothetical protein
MKTVIEMAREVGFTDGELSFMTTMFERFAELVRADERWEQSKRRGVLAFCPYTGRPRHPSDITSDPHGILILVPDQPIRAGGNT